MTDKIDVYNPTPAKPTTEVAVGDRIAVRAPQPIGVRGVPFNILTVERLTATQFVTTEERRFYRKNGAEQGASHYRQAIIVDDAFVDALDTFKQEIQVEREARSWLCSISQQYRNLQLPAIMTMKAAYEQWQAQQGEGRDQRFHTTPTHED